MLLALLAAAQLVLGAGALVASSYPEPDADPVGRRLTLEPALPMMQPVNAPARVARVAVVPGSRGREAWAIGFSRARKPGYDQTTPSGQVVFLHYTAERGWQVDGPPRDATGRPVNQLLSSLAVASNGEGWAVGAEGAMYHHRPGRGWVMQAARTTTNTLYGVALGGDGAGVFGYAVGAGLTFLRLDAEGWAVDQISGSVPSPGGTVPDLSSVAAVSRDRAWAVSGTNSNALLVFRRADGVWSRALTGQPMFDQPPAPASGNNATVNQFARGASVAATRTGAWVAGMMQPVDATKVAGDASTTDRTRPFALLMDDDGTLQVSHCPPIYQVSNSGVESTVRVCDVAFPYATGALATASIADDGTAFAAGFGLFRFTGDRWVREPSVVGAAVSAAFSSATEGWVATAGEVIGGSGIATSSSNTIGHWTAVPPAPALRRWPHASGDTLESVAYDASTGTAVAVGLRGAIARLSGDAGWEIERSPTERSLHAVAFDGSHTAWAVGSGGTILRFDGRAWRADPSSGRLTTNALFGVACASARCRAAGDKGVTLRNDGGGWRLEAAVTDARLSAVAAAGDDFVAVGDKGTILQDRGAGWRRYTALEKELRSGQEGENPNLLAVAGLPDGTALIGGSRSVLLERRADGSIVPSALPDLEGSIHALAIARRTRGDLSVLASVGTQGSRFSGDFLGQGHGWLFAGGPEGWRDLAHARAAAGTPDVDAPVLRDAVYGIALEPGGRTGWAVGGFPDNVFDDDGHLRTTSTASTWRIGLDGTPPASPAAATATLPRAEGISFAFLGDTACATGLCAAGLGAGSRGDVVMTDALRAIQRAADQGIVPFLVLGGDLRRNGIPDELEPVRTLLDSLSVPAFAAIGDKDLFAGIASSGEQQGGLLSSNGYFLRTFRSQPAPWGVGRALPSFRPVRLPGQPQGPDTARTHYAFDYAPDGTPRLRVVMLDTSRLPLAAGTEGQNPPEDQATWLQTVLADARSSGIPAVVAMHQPNVLPVSTALDASAVTGILMAGGASGVVASHTRANDVVLSPSGAAPDAIPVGIFGGGGSPLQRGADPVRGAYHAWQIVTVDTDPASQTITGHAPVTFRSIPVLESIALRAWDGRRAGAGDTLRFTGLGRLPDVGGPHGLGRAADQAQGRATYVPFPFPRACELLETPERNGCKPATVAEPDLRFVSEDPTIAEFVRADPDDPARPFRDPEGRLVRDDHNGLLCAFEPGTATIRLESGFVATRVPVTVGAGSGPCTPRVFAPVSPNVIVPEPERPGPAPEDEPFEPNLLRPRLPEPAAVAALAPPIVNAAPAPPGGGAGQRQEEQQAASERAEMTALGSRARTGATTTSTGIVVAVGVMTIAFVGALAARPRRRPTPAPALVISPDPARRNP